MVFWPIFPRILVKNPLFASNARTTGLKLPPASLRAPKSDRLLGLTVIAFDAILLVISLLGLYVEAGILAVSKSAFRIGGAELIVVCACLAWLAAVQALMLQMAKVPDYAIPRGTTE